MQTERINYLFNQWLQDALSPEEHEAFFDLLRDPSNGKSITEILQELMERQQDGLQWNGLRLNEMVHAVLSADKRQHPDVAPPIARIVRLRRLVAAAAILIFISLSAYFYFHNTSKQDIAAISVQERFKNDLSPGRNKAILTLSNGVRIILDSAANGTLANQGSTRIIKIDSGLLAYNASAVPVDRIQTWNTLSTPRGGQFQLLLPDGTKVWLNAASSITYPTAFVGKKRKVTITGEAYFEVLHNTKQPFEVKVGNNIIQDIGTAFNVNAYSDEKFIATTLLEGAVDILSTEHPTALPGSDFWVPLRPGQQAVSSLNDLKISVKKSVDVEGVMAWRNGRMELYNGDVKRLFQDISRWYDVDVEYKGEVPEGQFSGALNRNVPLSSLLKVLRAYGIQTEVKDKQIIVL